MNTVNFISDIIFVRLPWVEKNINKKKMQKKELEEVKL